MKKNVQFYSKVFTFFFLGSFLQSCSTTVVLKTKSTNRFIEKVNLLAVRYRRPDFPVAEQGYLLKNNQSIECLSSSELWKDLRDRSSEVIACLNSLGDESVNYFYVIDQNPHLELDEKDPHASDCLKKSLSRIVLPREVYYLADQEGSEVYSESQGCYSSSFSTRTNELLKTSTTWLKKRIQLPLSSDRTLKDSNDLLLWLMVTTFNVLKSDEQARGSLWGAPVPELICKACFKNDALFEDKWRGKIKPVFWP